MVLIDTDTTHNQWSHRFHITLQLICKWYKIGGRQADLTRIRWLTLNLGFSWISLRPSVIFCDSSLEWSTTAGFTAIHRHCSKSSSRWAKDNPVDESFKILPNKLNELFIHSWQRTYRCVTKLRDNKIVFGLSQNNKISFYFILPKLHVSITWLLSGHLYRTSSTVTCSACDVHGIWDPLRLTNVSKCVQQCVY